MAAEEATNNSPSIELARLLSGQRYMRKHKKKIALIGPAIDRLSSHVKWGNRLSSSFYRTIGLNVSLRTVTNKNDEPKTEFEFVIWQFSPKLSPSLLKSYLRGTAALVVAVETVSKGSKSTSSYGQEDDFTRTTKSAEHFYSDEGVYEESDSPSGEVLDIELLEKSAEQLKLPMAFIHFVAPEFIEQGIQDQKIQKQDYLPEIAQNEPMNLNQKTEFMCLRETKHSLHLVLSADQNSESCLNQAFDYIAGHFASAA